MNHYCRYLSALLLCTSLNGCLSTEYSHGYTLHEESLSAVKPGMSQKSVKALLGSPSSVSSFGKEIWYYISTTSESIAFAKPELTKSAIISIHFDEKNQVKSIQNYTEADAKRVAMSNDITPTEGNDITLLQQLLGNVGRFNSNPEAASLSGGSRAGGGRSPY